jgi:hypothetical protein
MQVVACELFALHLRSVVLPLNSLAVRKRLHKSRAKARATNDSQLVVRLPGSLVERVDDFAAHMRTELPGVRFARAEAVRVLLTRALDELKGRRP